MALTTRMKLSAERRQRISARNNEVGNGYQARERSGSHGARAYYRPIECRQASVAAARC
ncbi:hypothethical protein (plasmid) [Ralstonia solanacearum CMR15]|nr:hypothethical protein [Ralstonia solanacearum CMR15]